MSDEKTTRLYPGETTIEIHAMDDAVAFVARPPAAVIPLSPDEARLIARRLRKAAELVEYRQRHHEIGKDKLQ